MYSYRSLDLPVRESNNGLPPAYIVPAGSPYGLSPSAAIHRSIRIRTSAGTGGNVSSSKAGGVWTEGGRTRSRAPNRTRANAKPATVSRPVLVSSHLPMNAIECRYPLWSAKTAASGTAGNPGGLNCAAAFHGRACAEFFPASSASHTATEKPHALDLEVFVQIRQARLLPVLH